MDESSHGSALAFCRGVVTTLNYGYGCPTDRRVRAGGVNAAQRAALRDFGRHAIRLCDHLSIGAPGDLTEASAWDSFQCKAGEPILELNASAVDCPLRAGRCDPLPLIPDYLASRVSSADYMFGDAPPGLEKFGGFYAGCFTEYVKLTVRMLKCGKVGLRSEVKGGGTDFSVGKKGGKQLEVFHGTRVSEACMAPPQPPHLAPAENSQASSIADSQPTQINVDDIKTTQDAQDATSALKDRFNS